MTYAAYMYYVSGLSIADLWAIADEAYIKGNLGFYDQMVDEILDIVMNGPW